jgi:hypothetical protein
MNTLWYVPILALLLFPVRNAPYPMLVDGKYIKHFCHPSVQDQQIRISDSLYIVYSPTDSSTGIIHQKGCCSFEVTFPGDTDQVKARLALMLSNLGKPCTNLLWKSGDTILFETKPELNPDITSEEGYFIPAPVSP